MPRDVPRFDRFITQLSQTHRFVSYSEAVNLVKTGNITEPTVTFSFDDGLQSNLVAANILERHGFRGMFFVPTGFIGTRTIPEAHNFFGHTVEINEPAMTWNDLEHLRERGHEVGNHTVTHRSLNEISHEEAVHEIGAAAETLRSRLGSCEHFAWPRGAHRFFPQTLRQTVFDTGHSTCASAVRGAHTDQMEDLEQLCIKRELVASYWPLRHSWYFIGRSAKSASDHDNNWPLDITTA